MTLTSLSGRAVGHAPAPAKTQGLSPPYCAMPGSRTGMDAVSASDSRVDKVLQSSKRREAAIRPIIQS